MAGFEGLGRLILTSLSNVVAAAGTWVTAGLTFNSNTLSAPSSTINTMTINDSGTTLYIAGTNVITEYNLSTPNRLTGATSGASITTPASLVTDLESMWYNSDGTKLFTANGFSKIIRRFSLSVPYDITTATDDLNSLSIPTLSRTSQVSLSADGTILIIGDSNADILYKYSLSTAFDLTTATDTLETFDVSIAYGAGAQDATFNPNGRQFLVLGNGTTRAVMFTMATPWDISNAVVDASQSFTVSTASTADFIYLDSVAFIAEFNFGGVYEYQK